MGFGNHLVELAGDVALQASDGLPARVARCRPGHAPALGSIQGTTSRDPSRPRPPGTHGPPASGRPPAWFPASAGSWGGGRRRVCRRAWQRRCSASAVEEESAPAAREGRDRHLPTIHNMLDTGLSNARVEANNVHLRVLTRQAYGYHSAKALITMANLRRGSLCPPLPGRS
ncbi:transposase [Micromonospora chersina]|uniref:transposase n=1 Tax=Micromonospora chersina TaxID=47854 RepID=UPI00371A37E4